MGASATTQTCSGPADLEARLRDHADAGAYAALSSWFSTNGQTDCATAVLQSGLKAFPDSDALPAALVSLDVRESHFEEASV